jgi:hypothetical protein
VREITYDELLEMLAEAAGREVYVEVGIPEGIDPPADYVPAVIRGRLGPVEAGYRPPPKRALTEDRR